MLKNGELIFALESIADLSIKEKEDQWFWTCHYAYKDNLAVDMVSLGHGPTENDEWDSSLDQRLEQYRTGETYQKLKSAYGSLSNN